MAACSMTPATTAPRPPGQITPVEPDLNRADAAAWFQARGYTHVTTRHLARLADAGRGPPYARLGKHAYYRHADLRAWLDQALRPVERGRTPAKEHGT